MLVDIRHSVNHNFTKGPAVILQPPAVAVAENLVGEGRHLLKPPCEHAIHTGPFLLPGSEQQSAVIARVFPSIRHGRLVLTNLWCPQRGSQSTS